jgi:hypothetical protein
LEARISEDHYLWIPGLAVNAKLRAGEPSGLKFKRLIHKTGDIEQWWENPDELFKFPLDHAAWRTLANDLQQAQLTLMLHKFLDAGAFRVVFSGSRTAFSNRSIVDSM